MYLLIVCSNLHTLNMTNFHDVAERMLLIEGSLISFPPVATVRLNFGLSNYSFTVFSLCCIWCLRACLTDWRLSYLTVKVTGFTLCTCVCMCVRSRSCSRGLCVHRSGCPDGPEPLRLWWLKTRKCKFWVELQIITIVGSSPIFGGDYLVKQWLKWMSSTSPQLFFILY